MEKASNRGRAGSRRVFLGADGPCGPINLTITDTLDGTIVNQNTASGTNTFAGGTAHFTAITATVAPSGAANLDATTLEVTSAATGTHIVTIIATQTGLSFADTGELTTFTYNGLAGAPGPDTDNAFVNGGAPIVTNTFPGITGTATFGPAATGPHTITSDAEEFIVTFTEPGQVFAGTIELVAVATAIPEPASLALLGSAFAGLGLLRRRRRTA